MKNTILLSIIICLMLLSCRSAGKESHIDFDKEDAGMNIQSIISILPEKPAGSGKPITERQFWARLRRKPDFKRVIPFAEDLINRPLPEITDDLYLDFSRTGNRTNWENIGFFRRERLYWYTLAECFENRGRFLPAFRELVYSLCNEKTWVLPAHDPDLSIFRGEKIDIDLGAAMLAWDLGTALWLLKPVLDDEIVQRIQLEIRTRVVNPYLETLAGKRKAAFWLSVKHNWNAVCLAGVTGAALAAADSKEERAACILAAAAYIKNFLNGFPDDGYCSEGLGYWNYGFGHFFMLAEIVCQATEGHVNLFALDKARIPALFGERIHIINNKYPAFTDCDIDELPSPYLMYHIKKRKFPGLQGWDSPDPAGPTTRLYEAMIYASPFPEFTSMPEVDVKNNTDDVSRTWFNDAGVLVCRPLPGSDVRLGAAIKGGNNDEFHNHNDLGSFVIVSGSSPVIFDPGPEIYTARTFSSRRYESNLLNSFGHSVPVVAGRLQETGADAKAIVASVVFSEKSDTLVLDMTSAYDVPALLNLTRTFVYSRENKSAVIITDTVKYQSKQTFGTALIIPGEWKRIDDTILMISSGKDAVTVTIDTHGAGFEIHPEIIKEESRSKIRPTRIGIDLVDAVEQAAVTLVIAPAVQ